MVRARIVYKPEVFQLRYLLEDNARNGTQDECPLVTLENFSPDIDGFKRILSFVEERGIKLSNQKNLNDVLKGGNPIFNLFRLFSDYKLAIKELDDSEPNSSRELTWAIIKISLEDQMDFIIRHVLKQDSPTMIPRLEYLANALLYDEDNAWINYIDSLT